MIGVYRQRCSEPGGELSVYLHGVGDPGNVGTVIRSAHALCDGPVVLGPGCADPFGAEGGAGEHGLAVRAAAGAGGLGELTGHQVALDAGAGRAIADAPVARPAGRCAWAPSATACPPSR